MNAYSRYGIPTFRIVAYTYDAAVHCNTHTERRYGLEPGKDWVRENATDSEGNSVHPIFTSDMDLRTFESCDDDPNETICMCCGFVQVDRKFGDPCTNCNTAWYDAEYSEYVADKMAGLLD